MLHFAVAIFLHVRDVPRQVLAVVHEPLHALLESRQSVHDLRAQRLDGKQRHYETNAIPLLFNRACFGWRMYLGGPNRVVSLKEVLTTSQPAEQVIAGPETEVSADKT